MRNYFKVTEAAGARCLTMFVALLTLGSYDNRPVGAQQPRTDSQTLNFISNSVPMWKAGESYSVSQSFAGEWNKTFNEQHFTNPYIGIPEYCFGSGWFEICTPSVGRHLGETGI